MYQSSVRIEVPITTLSDGTALLTVMPIYAFVTNFFPNSNFLPLATVAAGSTTLPFAAAPSYSTNNVFGNLGNSAVSFAIDTCSIDYVHTESALNTKGKVTSSVFY